MHAALVLLIALRGAQESPPEPPPPAPPPEQPAETAPAPPADAPPAEAPPDAPAVPAEPPAAVDVPPAPVPQAAPTPAPLPAPAAARLCPTDKLLCWQNDVAALWPKLRVRPGFEYVDADAEILYVGANDGFFLDSARLGVEGNVANLIALKLTLEAASLLPGAAPNQAVTPLVGAAADAWVAFTPSRWLVVRAGQQNMPADVEAADDVVALIPFTRRSVAATGVRAGHGNAVSGLSPARQIGVVVGSGRDARIGDVLVDYRVGIGNGNGANRLGNDNGAPAGYLRLGGGLVDLVRIGVGGRFNPRTVGTLPNLYEEVDALGFADIGVHALGAELVVVGQLRQTSLATVVPDPANPAGQESGAGVTGWLGYTFDLAALAGAKLDVKPAVRFSYYDPSSAFGADQLAETTVGVRVDGDPSAAPLSFLVDYTILTELGEGAVVRDLQNNRLTAMFQLEL